MNLRLGDTVVFSYKSENIHDNNPQVYFLAKVGNLIHGLNQHYQSPSEKSYFYLTLKSIYYNKIVTGKLDAYTFYHQYVKKRLITNSYRTYISSKMKNVKVANVMQVTQKVDIRPNQQKYEIFNRGEKIRFVSIVQNRLSMKTGTILGRQVPGFKYIIQTQDGNRIALHPSDIKKTTPDFFR